MSNPTRTRRGFLAAAGAFAAMACAPSLSAATLGRPDVIIGWTPWSDAEAVTKLTARILARGAGFDVELTLADIEAQFRTLARGETDLMLMSWEPDMHKGYLRRHGNALVDLGTLYTGTIGLAVPSWVSKDLISSIEDLRKPDIREALGATITGIDPGAGLMRTTRAAIDAYGLDGYTLSEGTGPKMVRAIARAKRGNAPIVVTAWRPHMKFPLYGMRYLEDPKGLFSSVSEIHARASRDFVERSPEIAGIIRRISFETKEIETLMRAARDIGIDAAVDTWISENSSRISGWLD